MPNSSSLDQRGCPDGYGPAGRSRWLDVDWNAHRRDVAVAGTRLNLVDVGSGPPLVFVHGLAGTWTNWLENICAFAGDRRVVALDLPGFGASQLAGEPITIGGYARLLDELCAVLGLDEAAFVGNSLGGLICADLALRRPARVQRLCLVAAAGLSLERLHLEHVLRVLVPLERVVSAYGGFVAARSQTLARRARLRRLSLSHVARYPHRLPPALAAELIGGAGRPGLLPGLRAMADASIGERLGAIACPTLVVWGERDRMVPARDAHEFARLIPGARALVYADTGHVPMLERPARFNADLRAFLGGDAT